MKTVLQPRLFHRSSSSNGFFDFCGPAASGLSPQPAIHFNIAFDQHPMDYLYNVIYCGEFGVGKDSLRGWLIPFPRHFTCGKKRTISQTDHCFGSYKKGSAGRGMMAFPGLSDDQVWQFLHNILTLAK